MSGRLLVTTDKRDDYLAAGLADIADRAPISYGDFQGAGVDDHARPVRYVGDVKRLTDLVHCVLGGHHIAQVQKAREAGFAHVFVIAELHEHGMRASRDGTLQVRYGERTDWRDHQPRVAYVRVFDYLEQLALICGVQVRTSGSRAETCARARSIWRYFQKPPGEHNATKLFFSAAGERPPGEWSYARPSLLRRTAKELEGVGWERSRVIDSAYGSVEELARKTPAQLQALDGIGDELARNIWSQLRGGKRWADAPNDATEVNE